MNIRKIGVVLLALLLAGMAMVPMVSAVSGTDNVKILDVNQVNLPHLQFDSAQQKISISDELKLTAPVDTSQIKQSLESVKDGKSGKIPMGAVIHHSNRV